VVHQSQLHQGAGGGFVIALVFEVLLGLLVGQDGFGVGEELTGAVAEQQQVIHRAGVVAGLDEMAAELGGQIFAGILGGALGAQALQGQAGAVMQALAAHGAHLVQQGGGDQGMGKAVGGARRQPPAAGARGLGDELGALGGLQGFDERIFALDGGAVRCGERHGAERLEIELPPEDRRQAQRLLGGRGQPADARLDGHADALGDAQLRQAGGLPAAGLVLQAAVVHQRLAHFFDKEGVALSLAVDQRHEFVLRRAGEHRLQHFGGLGARQAGELEALAQALAVELVQQVAQGERFAQLHLAVGQRQQQAQLGEVARQAARQGQGAAIGPMHVLQDDEQRGAAGERLE
jgi:hypothetical protein